MPTSIHYLVPTTWLHQFHAANPDPRSPSISLPALNLSRHVQTLQLQFRQQILAQLQHKCNYINISGIFISPIAKQECAWEQIGADLWHRLSQKLGLKFGVVRFQGWHLHEQYQVQIQIVYCSKSRSQAFVGYVPKDIALLEVVEVMGAELGFTQMHNTQITFPEKNADRSYQLVELQKMAIGGVIDSLVLVYNMDSTEAKEGKENKEAKEQENADDQVSSNRANPDHNNSGRGDLGIDSFQQVRNEGTASTGAETPSMFGSEGGDRGEVRLRELVREKKPEEIHQLRLRAQQATQGSLLQVPKFAQGQVAQNLEKIALQLSALVCIPKKRSCKQEKGDTS